MPWKAVVLKDPFVGIFEFAQRIVGMENLLLMMALGDQRVDALLDKLLKLKLSFWEMALPQLADPSSGSGQAVVDVVAQFDDYGTQESQLISPQMFRQQIKPRLKLLFERVKQLAPDAKRFFHSCGNVRPLLPDFIEIGVETLNPVHIRAAEMEPAALKCDFGDALVFWGGGVDTQGVTEKKIGLWLNRITPFDRLRMRPLDRMEEEVADAGSPQDVPTR